MMLKTSTSILPAIAQAEAFIVDRFAAAQKKQAVIAVSGGIDSAMSLTLLVRAMGADAVTALLLPYGEQDMHDAQSIAEWNGLSPSQIQTVSITSLVTAAADQLQLNRVGELAMIDQLRLGNLMARSRMMVVFDTAKKLDALVCGTENRTEHYLGYFTRFGDEASDFEPISGWWKTEVRAAAQALDLPAVFSTKAPSAGLWQGQTDETELGFSYEEADRVLASWVEWSQTSEATEVTSQGIQAIANLSQVPTSVVTQVLDRVMQTQFKREVPYRNE